MHCFVLCGKLSCYFRKPIKKIKGARVPAVGFLFVNRMSFYKCEAPICVKIEADLR